MRERERKFGGGVIEMQDRRQKRLMWEGESGGFKGMKETRLATIKQVWERKEDAEAGVKNDSRSYISHSQKDLCIDLWEDI